MSNGKLGLRIDVDTLRGTREGVAPICKVLARYGWRASFFFSLGPDNMGRHLWRLLRPAFLLKMLRSNAPALYGWEIILRGTFWPGPVIAEYAAPAIRAAADSGHEIGLHAWDHHAWQAHVDDWPEEFVRGQIQRGYDRLHEIIGRAPAASAAPAWRATDAVLLAKEAFNFVYNSDCRGTTVFYPCVGARRLQTPQVPTTLPTYDEIIGRNGITQANYNQRLLAMLAPEKLNVLTIHAEVEGGAGAGLFAQFAAMLAERGWQCCPLGDLVNRREDLPQRALARGMVPGRDGWVAVETEVSCV